MPYSFEPWCGKNPQVLILGSMPGAESLRKQAYYAYKHNRFWRIMYKYFDREYSEETAAHKELVIGCGVALFDVFKYCERENSSLDSKIKKEEPSDIDALLAAAPSVKGVILNGKKAAEGWKKFFSHVELPSFVLPSTSPANAAKSFEILYKEWKNVLDKFFVNI